MAGKCWLEKKRKRKRRRRRKKSEKKRKREKKEERKKEKRRRGPRHYVADICHRSVPGRTTECVFSAMLY